MFTYENFRSIVKELDSVPIDAYNAPCVVNTDDIIVYDIGVFVVLCIAFSKIS